MGCPACSEYAKTRKISLPDDLREAIDFAAKGVASGNLRETSFTRAGYEGNTPFDELAAGGPWDDGLEYHFACTACGQEFVLHAETYHGRGGAWCKSEDVPWHGREPVNAGAGGIKGVTVFVAAVVVLLASLAYLLARDA
jgi:hypothetical protein